MAKVRIKKGDTVQVISGPKSNKGKQGKVIAVYVETNRVLVEGVNRIKKHTKVGTSGRGREDRRHHHAGSPHPHQQRRAGGPGDEEADPRRHPHRDRRARRPHQDRARPVRQALG